MVTLEMHLKCHLRTRSTRDVSCTFIFTSRYDQLAADPVEIASRSQQKISGYNLLASAHGFYGTGCELIVAARRNKSARCVSDINQ